MAEVLIIVDVQNDFCEGGSLAVAGGAHVADVISEHVLRAASIGRGYDAIVATKDWHIDPGTHFADEPDYADSWPRHCEADTDGAKFHVGLAPVEHLIDEIFYKGHYTAAYSGFEGKSADGQSLEGWLREFGALADEPVTVTVVGIALDYCVKATAEDAARLGFVPQIISTLTVPVHARGATAVRMGLRHNGVIVHDIPSR